MIIAAPFHSKAFALLYQFYDELNVAWRTALAWSKDFFAISGVSKLYFSWTCFRLNLLTVNYKSYLVRFPLLYLAFFKTISAVLFRIFGLSPRFLSVKPPFLYDHLTTQHPDFSIFLGISLTDKPVDRNTCFCSHVAECFFVERVYLLGYSQITSKEFEYFGLQDLLVQRTFGARLHRLNFESKDGTRVVWNIKLDWKSQLFLKLYADQVQSYCVTDL